MAVARVGGVPHASHTWAHVRLHVVAEAILRIDRVAEITGNGPRAPKLLAGDAFAARCARSQVTLAVASSREIVHTGAYKVLVKPDMVADSCFLSHARRLGGNRGG